MARDSNGFVHIPHRYDPSRFGAFFMGLGYFLICLSLVIHPPKLIPGYKYTSFDIVASAHIWLLALLIISVMLMGASMRPDKMVLAHGFAGTVVSAYAIASLGAGLANGNGWVGFGLCLIVATSHWVKVFSYPRQMK